MKPGMGLSGAQKEAPVSSLSVRRVGAFFIWTSPVYMNITGLSCRSTLLMSIALLVSFRLLLRLLLSLLILLARLRVIPG
jgi:hypothetical protein